MPPAVAGRRSPGPDEEQRGCPAGHGRGLVGGGGERPGHVEDPSSTGSAFVDTEYGVVTEFETPAQRLVVSDLGRLPRDWH